MPKINYNKIADFLFEVGTLRNMQRMHCQYLLLAEESIAEHCFRTAIIAMVLAELEGADQSKAMKMALLHDIAEVRTGDANYVHKQYVKQNETKAYSDLLKSIPNEKSLIKLLNEYEERKSKESIIAKDADRIDQIILQKEYMDNKSYDFKRWHRHIAKAIQTRSAKKLAQTIKERRTLQWLYDL